MRSIVSFLFFCLAIMITTHSSASAPVLPSNVTAGTVVEGVASYTFANGLTVLLFPDDSKPTTTVNITYKVGSRQENYGETGMAHLLEHLMFKGTPTHANIFEELGKRGMRFNGSTYFDRTNYFETFTADPASLEWALAMEADRMVNANIWRSDLDSEMTVVRNEFENWENDPRRVLWGRMQATAFDWHNYGNLTIGARSDIENVDIARLRAFYQTYYQPDNAVLIVAGRFDPEATLRQISDTFGKIPKPTRSLPRLYTEEPVQEGTRSVTVRRAGGTPWVAALYRTAAGPDPDSVALEALGEIMTLQPSGRLYQALVANHKASNVDAWSFSLAEPGMLIFWMQLAPKDSVSTVKKTLFQTLYSLKKAPITPAEVNRVRTRMLKDYNDLLRDPEHFAIALSEAIAQGDWRLFFIQRDQWRSLSADDVQKAALNYLKPSNVTVGEYQPLKAVTKDERVQPAARIDVEKLVQDYKGDAAIAAGETFDASPENLEKRTQRTQLSNGMKVAFLPKKTRGEAVRFNLRLNWGDINGLKGLATTGLITADMLSMGTKTHDRQAFEDAIDALEARLSISGDATGVYISGETVRRHLPSLLALAAEALREPTFPEAELGKMIRERLTDIEAERTDPRAIAQRAMRRTLRPWARDDIRYVFSFDEEEEQLKHVTIAKLKSFHRKFYGANHGELAIVGDFDPTAMQSTVEKLFGKWNNTTPYARVEDPYQKIAPQTLRFETPDKANAFLMGGLPMPLNDLHPDFAALLVANQLLGGSTEARLPNRLRSQDGLSYSVGSGLQPNSIDANTRFVLYAIFAPQNLTRVEQGFNDVLTEAIKAPPEKAEVDDAIQSLLEARRISRAQDRTQAANLVSQLYLTRTWDESAQRDAAIAAVTPDDVFRVLKKHLDPKAIVWSIAGDFANAKMSATPAPAK